MNPSDAEQDASSEVVILDSTSFYAGIPYTSVSVYYTTDSVIKEVAHGDVKRSIIESLAHTGRIKVLRPSDRYMRVADEAARRSGDRFRLSETDVTVLALGLELRDKGLKVTVISDDHSVENLAKILGLNTASVLTSGIRKVVRWIVYCRGCGKVFKDSALKMCDVCGSPLKRRIKKVENR